MIMSEVKENLHLLPEAVRDLYNDPTATKIRRRMSDQITKYLNTKMNAVPDELSEDVANLQHEEARRRELSKKAAPQKRKELAAVNVSALYGALNYVIPYICHIYLYALSNQILGQLLLSPDEVGGILFSR